MNNKVIKMINSYTKKKESEKVRTHGEKRVSRRRTMVFGGFMLAIIGVLLIVAFQQKSENNALGVEVADRESILEEKTTEAEDLEQQIKQLNDDDYITRIARSEFFLSEDGEIIFNLAEDEGEENEGNSSNSNNSEE